MHGGERGILVQCTLYSVQRRIESSNDFAEENAVAGHCPSMIVTLVLLPKY